MVELESSLHRLTRASILLLASQALGAPLQVIGGTAAREVDFPTRDGGRVIADFYAGGPHTIVLAHGAVFNKESWNQQAKQLQDAGFSILAIDFRGYGSTLPGHLPHALHEDILGAMQFASSQGATSVSIIGGSMGATAAAAAAKHSQVGDIQNLVLLAPPTVSHPARLHAARTLLVVSAQERLRAQVETLFERIPGPKTLKIIPGRAHAQHIFKTDQADALMSTILDFLLTDTFGIQPLLKAIEDRSAPLFGKPG